MEENIHYLSAESLEELKKDDLTVGTSLKKEKKMFFLRWKTFCQLGVV